MKCKAILTLSFSSLLLASSALAEPQKESSAGSHESGSDKSKTSKDKQESKEASSFLEGLFDGVWMMGSSPGCEYGTVLEEIAQ